MIQDNIARSKNMMWVDYPVVEVWWIQIVESTNGQALLLIYIQSRPIKAHLTKDRVYKHLLCCKDFIIWYGSLSAEEKKF